MAASMTDHQVTQNHAHLKVTWLLVAGLFILRIPIATIVPMVAPSADWADPVFFIGTYFLTALLIWWERERLADFHVDKLVLLIFILGKPLELFLYQHNIPFADPARSPAYLLYQPIALGLAIALLVARPTLPKLTMSTWVWMIIGLLSGIALAVYFGEIFKIYMPGRAFNGSTPNLVVFTSVQQMLAAGMAEEPFFRGFLWGCMRKSGMKDVWIWLAQAGLFWLGHAYALPYAPFSFWLIVPVAGLVLGLLAWRSRSIAVSMLAHGLANGLSQFI